MPHGVHEVMPFAKEKGVIVYLQRESVQSASCPTHGVTHLPGPTHQPTRTRGQWAYPCTSLRRLGARWKLSVNNLSKRHASSPNSKGRSLSKERAAKDT